MRIWRGGSPGSGPVGGRRDQAAWRHARPGSAARRVSTWWRWRAEASRGAAGGGARRSRQRARGAGGGNGDRAAACVGPGDAGRVVRLGLVVNGLVGQGNREKLIFDSPLGFQWLVN
jgi:hypothetical protein